jgi:flavoprotein
MKQLLDGYYWAHHQFPRYIWHIREINNEKSSTMLCGKLNANKYDWAVKGDTRANTCEKCVRLYLLILLS